MAKQIYWEDVKVGDELPSNSYDLNPKRIVLQVSGSQDFYDVHHNVEFVRGGGVADVYVNTRFMQSCLTRVVADWMGDDGWLKKFRMEMRRMNFAGDVMTCKAKVAEKKVEAGEHLVELDLWAENDREGMTTPCKATVVLPAKR